MASGDFTSYFGNFKTHNIVSVTYYLPVISS